MSEKLRLSFFFFLFFLFGASSVINSANAAVNVRVTSQFNESGPSSTYSFPFITGFVNQWTDEADNQPNPCFGNVECYLGLSVQYSMGVGGLANVCDKSLLPPGMAGENNKCLVINQYRTIGEVRQAFINQIGLFTYYAIGFFTGNTPVCMGLFYSNSKAQGVHNDVSLFPGSNCVKMAPLTQVCKLFSSNQSTTVIDHGTFDTNTNLESTPEVETIISIYCRQEGDVILSAKAVGHNNQRIDLKKTLNGQPSGMYATLSIDGQEATQGLRLHVQRSNNTDISSPNRYTLKSKLHGEPVVGYHFGAIVIYLEFP